MGNEKDKAEVVLGIVKDLLIASKISVPRTTTSDMAESTTRRKPNSKEQADFEATVSFLVNVSSKQYDTLNNVNQTSQK
ncbi:MAG: hypothetical protein HQL06_15370 [Nitrospirae bacterium]|nr:hypothetical protein [Nitrospirota bacterium]